MVLESTVICIDNSEYMRNGDYLPTRIQAQQDAANLVCRSKLRSNPENNVALLSLSDVQVHVTLTMDSGKLLSKLHMIQPKGKIRFLNGIRVAHLALKHRQSKNHRMRIVAFVGSPVEDDEKEIIKVAKKLKKEKVNVEIVNFGEEEINTPKLTPFIETLNGKGGTDSNIVNIPPGSMLSDALLNSPICAGEAGAPSTEGGDFGLDPASDPDLALAIRVSLEEQRHRQEEEARAAGETQETQSAPATAMATGTGEDDMLRAALAMSMGQEVPSTAPPGGRAIDIAAMSEEEQIAYAMQMSMQDDVSETPMETEPKTATESPMEAEYADDGDDEDVITDPEFLQSVLQNLPGVDTSSEAIQQAMDQLAQSRQEEEKKGDEKKEKD